MPEVKKAHGFSVSGGTASSGISEILKKASKEIERGSNQKDDQTGLTLLFPSVDFETYDVVYEGSYIVAGITDKIAFAMNSGIETENEDLKKEVSRVDIIFSGKSLVKYGNLFLEVVRNLKGEVVEVIPFVTSTVSKIKGGGFVQTVGSETIYFNKFTPDKEKRSQGKKIRESSGAGDKDLKYVEASNSVGYNPNLTEVYQAIIPDTTQKNYGVSFFKPALQQILLLKYIDEYYNAFFENGTIDQSIFSTEDTLDKETEDALATWLKDEAKGVKNAHSSFFLDTKIEALKLTQTLDTEAFLAYRTKLERSIAMRLNISYDLISSESSNKASASTAMKNFYQYLIVPMQEILIKAFQEIYSGTGQFSDEDLASLQFQKLDTEDNLEEAKTAKELYDAGIITLDEARAWMGYKPLKGVDGSQIKEQTDVSLKLGKDDVESITKAAALIKNQYNNEQTKSNN